jgi:hypothetical protein
LNSAINPAIYIARNSEMRSSLRRHFRRISNAITRLLCRHYPNNVLDGEAIELDGNPRRTHRCGLTIHSDVA